MEQTFSFRTYTVQLHRRGAEEYVKMSFPLRTGVYSVVDSPQYEMHFNLNGEIIRARGRGATWPHPHEWLKRSRGNDWIYYSTGGYAGVFEATGEYYLPNLPYATNALMGGKPLQDPIVADLVHNWPGKLAEVLNDAPESGTACRRFLETALGNTPQVLQNKAEALFAILGGRVSVLPPDARHVDYDVIPLTVADGCLYKCRFCTVKNSRAFRERNAAAVAAQIEGLKRLYDRDLPNYNSVFLGEHDALQASPGRLTASAESAIQAFGFEHSYLRGANFFLFGSTSSLLNAPDSLFQDFSALPANFYINVGLESADQETLDFLGKPVRASEVVEAFSRIKALNDAFPRLEVTANFVMDDELPPGHLPAMLHLLRDGVARVRAKGAVYLSPLRFDQPSKAQVYTFHRIKAASRVPTFLYIIQRL